MPTSNPICAALGIDPPALEAVRDHADASTYSLLIVALLERGEPMTLAEVADRFESAGIAPAPEALRSLQRCRPGRPPVHRDGDRYSLDPHDDELDLWAFRLGLRPSRWDRAAAALPPEPGAEPPPGPLPGPEVPLTLGELEEAFRGQHLDQSWSGLRLAIALADAHGGAVEPLRGVDLIGRLATHHYLRPGSLQIRRGGPISFDARGRWCIDPSHPQVLRAREAVRAKVETMRERRARLPSPEHLASVQERIEREFADRVARLASLRRVLVYAQPPARPAALTLIDTQTREVRTFIGPDEIAAAREIVDGYEWIGAVGVRPLLRVLGIEGATRHLAELGPPQKTITAGGRTTRITTEMLIRASCGIRRPFTTPAAMKKALAGKSRAALVTRMEADARSLFALYRYGMLQRGVLVRAGGETWKLPVAWSDRAQTPLRDILKSAWENECYVEAVLGAAPPLEDPWAGAEWFSVVRYGGSAYRLVGADGEEYHPEDAQTARLVVPGLHLRR